jgi:hypothetical protein
MNQDERKARNERPPARPDKDWYKKWQSRVRPQEKKEPERS